MVCRHLKQLIERLFFLALKEKYKPLSPRLSNELFEIMIFLRASQKRATVVQTRKMAN